MWGNWDEGLIGGIVSRLRNWKATSSLGQVPGVSLSYRFDSRRTRPRSAELSPPALGGWRELLLRRDWPADWLAG
jgi:hypothetical protein